MNEKPTFHEIDLTRLVVTGVLMAANERFFWPLGLALTWEFDKPTGTASNLHVRQWTWPDGHREAIGIEPGDEIAGQRRAAFALWSAERIASLTPKEQPAAINASEPVETPLVDRPKP